MQKPRVILRSCADYNRDLMGGIIKETVQELGFRFQGKVFIKPNVVTANKKYIHNSFTHPQLTAAMAEVIRKDQPESLVIGESGGFGIPSRLFFKESGYFDMAKKEGITLLDLNEHPLIKTTLSKAKWHKEMLLSKYIAEADVKVWMPKLKYHIFASITHALKLNIGLLVHKERMLYHDHRIHEKIVDLLEPGYPDLVVGDAIDITYGFESAPYPVRLGLLIFADNPLAADVVAAHIMGYDPHDVVHLKIAEERGYGSLNIDDIDVSGDADLEELKARPKGKNRLFQVLSELDTPITFYSGAAWDTGVTCDGGCEGGLKGCLGTIEKRTPGSLKKARPGAIVCGVYDGDVICPDGPVMLIGSCARVTGRLEAQKVYRIKGCPIGVRDLMIKVPYVFKLPSPMFDPRDAVLFIWNSIVKGFQIFKNRVLGKA
ncbi:protein of unknown function DUF362 [Desulfatibacillum aliphaticivorans]|uniref:DUF362 domain-containing protein n=1 Tax=Desulfatibacillum aliphaticivorans TaxID=218208 RepID=B8FFA8_DESAL|nr:DUF362 domain-containing protein [Desulfatibacillum aliphaticivorans]ACL04168.1 protein of unknown function DUF362 [Desulfatibacillum aliphaticivorans]